MDERLIIVSSDSHAGIPHELWTEYMDPRFHDLIKNLREDNEIYPVAMAMLSARVEAEAPFPEHHDAHSTGWHGLHDAVLRMADMDREGITAEFVFHGDSRLGDLFHNVNNRTYPFEVWHAGAHAWNHWAADNFGFALDRFLLCAAVGPCVDMDAAVAEIHWIAEHSFTATYGPHYMTHPDMPPLHHEYWDPYWAACAERNIAVVVHAGFGTQQGQVFDVIEDIYGAAAEAAGTTERDAMIAHYDAVPQECADFFTWWVNRNVESRRPLWQMTLGGVFDRHPALRLMLTEIRLDWIPATLTHLDHVFEEHRDDVPAKKKPSDYWHENCLAGASFVHKVEVDRRHEIGVDTILFGRDYPHPESTWPHTREWLQEAFVGVPEDEVRAMLGENAIRFAGLDRERLAEIARRIGPTIEDITGPHPDIRPELMANFDARGGFHKPWEGDEQIELITPLVEQDLAIAPSS
jgi:predicted TIM-barrel fold metal-dependent hydrolase